MKDNDPRFDREQYSVSVPEDLAVGTHLMSVRATDADEGDNAKLEYTLLPSRADSARSSFRIDPILGMTSPLCGLLYMIMFVP